MTLLIRLLRHAVEFEIGIWVSLYRWVFRRPRVPHFQADGFSYVAPLTPILWAFIGVSAIEVPAAHLLLPWEPVRLVVLVLGVWGLLWMVGLLASLKTYPHVVDEHSLRVRYGYRYDVKIPWGMVAAIVHRRRDLPSSRKIHRTETDGGTMLQVAINGQTNIDVELREPLTVSLPSGPETFSAIRCYADDPGALVTCAQLKLTTDASRQHDARR